MLICTLVNIFTFILAMYDFTVFQVDIITLMSIYHMYFTFNIFSIILCLQFERYNNTSVHGFDYFFSNV